MQIEAHGHPLHTRSLTIETQIREDGRWRVRGDVVDLRKCSFVPMIDDIQPAGIIHQMSIEFVLDPETRRFDGMKVEQPHVAVEVSRLSAGESCRDAGPLLLALDGEVLDDGFMKRLGLQYGGPRGCSHLLTLFQLMANALPVALDREAAVREADGIARHASERPFRRAVFIEGFEAESGQIQLVGQLGDFITHAGSEDLGPMARLAHQRDVRVEVMLDGPTRAMRGWRLAERTRDGETLHTAPWDDRTGEMASFDGAPIAPGMAKRVLDAFGAREDRIEQRDLLLQLAPGYVQVLAAISERFYGGARTAKSKDAASGEAEGGGVDMLGGMHDSCWLWRSSGRLHQAREKAQAAGMRPAPTKLPGS